MSAETRYRQVYRSTLPSSLRRHLVMLRLEPTQISKRADIKFAQTNDDLGELQLAVVRTVSGKSFGMTRHLHSPVPGVIIHTSLDSDSLVEDFTEILNILKVKPDEVSWLNPDVRDALTYINKAYTVEAADTPSRPVKPPKKYFTAKATKRKTGNRLVHLQKRDGLQNIQQPHKQNRAVHTSHPRIAEGTWNFVSVANLTSANFEAG